MDVTVIVPFYNNVEWLYEAINSINEKSNVSYEIIIVDDGSKEKIDFNKMRIKREQIRYIRQDNKGPGKARNLGIEDAKGEYIAFLDSDDVFIENKLTKQLEFMRNHEFYWSHTSYIKFYPHGEEKIVDNESYSGDVFPKCFVYNPIATPTVMVKKDALEKPEKRFSEEMRYGQDGFLWCQLASAYNVGVLKEPLSKVRMRGTNATLKAKNHLYVKANMYKYFKSKEAYFGNKSIPTFINFTFGVCYINNQLIERVFSKILGQNMTEHISRILYAPQYLLLKIYKRYINKFNNNIKN